MDDNHFHFYTPRPDYKFKEKISSIDVFSQVFRDFNIDAIDFIYENRFLEWCILRSNIIATIFSSFTNYLCVG